VLGGTRPIRPIAADAARMRDEMTRHKPPAGPLDAKLLPGGLVDLEFAVHVRQLERRIGFHPDMALAIAELVAAGALPPTLVEANAFLNRLLIALRLLAPDMAVPAPATCALIARLVGAADWNGVLACLDSSRQNVSACWQAIREAGE